MKKILLSLLASTICFTSATPVWAGTTPVLPGNGILYNNFGNANPPEGGLYDNMSRTKVFITIEGQKLILVDVNGKQIPLLSSLSTNNPAIKDFVFLLTGDKGKVGANSTEIVTAQTNVINKLISLGLDVSEGRPARQLIKALTLLIPFGNEAIPSDTIGVAAVDGTKMYQAITAFNDLVIGLTESAKSSNPEVSSKALTILKALQEDETFLAISSTLRGIRDQLKDEEKKTATN